MPYRHDVFISYRRDPIRNEWLIEHFIPEFKSVFKEAITAETDRDPDTIFFDQTELSDGQRQFDQKGIEPGQDWQQALRDAIRESRCVLALWSPQYFRSRWCNIEWRSFVQRGDQEKCALVVPVSVFDGHSFPDEASKFQIVDLNDYVRRGDGYKLTARFIEFQDRVRVLAVRVAQVVAAAPQFKDWHIAEPGPDAPAPEIRQPKL